MVAPPPRRPGPGGARPLPGGRPKLGISLGIPAANVPGGNVDQAGEGGWMSASGTPIRENPPPVLSTAASSSSPSPRPLPPPSIHPAPVASVSAPPPRRPALPTLASNPLPSSGSSSARPALSLHASSTSTAVPAFSLSTTTTPTPSPHGGPHPPRLSGLHPPGPAGGHSPSPSPSPSASSPAIPTQSARPRLPTLALNGGPAPLTPAASPKPSLKLVNPYASPVAAGSVEDTPSSGSSSPPVFASYASSSSVALPPPPPPQPHGRPRGPSLSLEIATPIRQAPPPPPPPPMPRHDPSSLLGYYYGDDEGGDERTVRPLSMDSDAGSYGAYGGLGAVYQAPGSLDRTLLPGSGVSERNQSSMVDDLRHTIGQLRVSASPLPSPGLGGGGDGGGNGTGRGLVSQEKQQGPAEDEAAKAPLAFEASDLEDLAYLGEGAGGAVTKVRSKKTGVIMAKKLIPASPNPSIHRQILRELQFLADCTSPNIVDHYGSFLTDGDSMIGILMEYCEGKSLDAVVKESRERGLRSSEKILGKIAVAVLRGLDYLHERKIIHRDIKPSNVLVTRQGQFKICDFGVAGELVGSLAGTFTGTSFYMAPERILGKDYSIKSDVWSLGLSLLEVANNRFPFPPEGEPPIVGQFDLLNFIVNQDPPQLVDDESVTWTDKAKDFVRLCLERTDGQRPYPRDLILHPFVKSAEKRKTDLAKWIAHVWGWPQLQTAPTGGE